MKLNELAKYPVHLGKGGSASAEPEFSGDMNWYEAYVKRHADDGMEGRLVSMYRFSESWDMWEVHPNGGEVVLCIEGTMTLHQEKPDGARASITLAAGEFAINEPGTWHTADVDGEVTALFITAGWGTEHRPR